MEAGDVSTSPVILKPGVLSSYGNGWRLIWKYFLELFLIVILSMLITISTSIFNWAGALRVIIVACNILVIGPVNYGVCFVYHKAVKGEKLETKDMFAGFNNFCNVVLANLLVNVIVFIGFILLIVPGIVFACKLAFTPYLVMDKKMEVTGAIKESWRMTRGYAWKVFLTGLLAIPILLAGFICLVFGIIISFMWINAAFASLYHAVDSSSKAAEKQYLNAP